MKILSALFVLILSTPLWSAQITQGDYKNRPEVMSFINKMVAQSDYSETELVSLFSKVKKQQHLFAQLNRPAEKSLQWYQYRRIFIKQKRIEQGAKFWNKHEQLLNQVSANTGVPEEIIVAIIGVETFYGIYRGKDPVFDSLVTLAFDYPKRAKFFMRELEQFLLLVKEQRLQPRQIKGSYAGAMGMPQFIASSYRNYAVDGDGDGQINLFESIHDITASVANYFVKHNWRSGEPVAEALTLLKVNSVAELDIGIKPKYKWNDLASKGLMAQSPIDPDTSVALLKFEQQNYAEYWAGRHNFYVITRYNHSELYAMAVYQLSRLIKAKVEANR